MAENKWKPQTPEEWARWRAEVALEERNTAAAESSKVADDAYDSTELAESTKWNNLTAAELASDWEALRRYAKIRFPEGARYTNLSPNNKLVAIAHCMGWLPSKIAAASGISSRTIYTWLKRPDILVFIEEFQLKEGQADPDKKWTDLSFKAMKFADDILSDPDNSDSNKRLKADMAKWVVERKYGKAAQPIEHRGSLIKELFTAISNTPAASVSAEEEEELFGATKQEPN